MCPEQLLRHGQHEVLQPPSRGEGALAASPLHAVVLGAKAWPGIHQNRGCFVQPLAPLQQHVAALMGLSATERWGKRMLARN